MADEITMGPIKEEPVPTAQGLRAATPFGSAGWVAQKPGPGQCQMAEGGAASLAGSGVPGEDTRTLERRHQRAETGRWETPQQG